METHWWKSRTVRPASGDWFNTWRRRYGVGLMWEKLRFKRCVSVRGCLDWSLRSSLVRVLDARSAVERFLCLLLRPNEGVGVDVEKDCVMMDDSWW